MTVKDYNEMVNADMAFHLANQAHKVNKYVQLNWVTDVELATEYDKLRGMVTMCIAMGHIFTIKQDETGDIYIVDREGKRV